MLETFPASDGALFAVERRTPAGEARGRVVLLHGIRSHAGWYGASCAKLTAAGYETCFLERRGAGRSPGPRGDAPSFRRLLADVTEFLAAQPPAPTHLVGISWGAKLALGAATLAPVASLVLVAPGFVPRVRPPLATRLRIAVARLARPAKLFDVPLNDPELFTADPRWQGFLRDNPHDLRRATARFLVGSVLLDRWLRRRVHAAPTLTLLAGADRVIDNARTRDYVAHFTHPANRVVESAGLGHTLEFEDRQLAFVDEMLAWFAAHPKTR